jgi:putative hydrolase of the HAD superfamily
LCLIPVIKAVTYDLWNTLVHNRNYGEFRLPSLKKTLRENGYSFEDSVVEDAYMGGFRHSGRIIRSENHRHVEPHEIVTEVLRLLGVEKEALIDELALMYEDSFMCDPPKLKEGVFEALEYTKKYKVGLVSVTGMSPGRHVRGVMKGYGILDYFESLSFSDEVKWVKPNIKLYHHASEALGVAPEEVVHIGDSMKGDIVGAIDAGMKVIWVKTKEQPRIEGYEPDGVITSLLELPEVLRSLE